MKAKDFAKGMQEFTAFENARPRLEFKNGAARVQDDGSLFISGSHLTAKEALELGKWLLRVFGDDK